MSTPSILRPLTDPLTDAEREAASKALLAMGLQPLKPNARLLDALNQVSYLDTTSFVEGAQRIRRAVDTAGGNHD